MANQFLVWTVFNIFVLLMLLLDLGVFHKGNRVIGIRESLAWSGIWVLVALLFNGGIYLWYGSDRALEFFTVYLVERSLSIDNIFVFILIFAYFKVAAEYQYKVLFWGILGALVMRAIFIVAGVALINKFHWMIYVFGALLIYVGAKLAFEKDKEVHPEKNPVIGLFRRFFPMTHEHEGGRFMVERAGKFLATPLLLVLLVVETTDVIFAANVFAILGLRALYFAVAGCMNMFCYLHYGLAAILIFVGFKMVLADICKIPIGWALGIVVALLSVSILASIVKGRLDRTAPPHEDGDKRDALQSIPGRTK